MAHLFPVRPRETVSMMTRDGCRLDADLYRPDADGEFPVLLMRQPYGRTIASTVTYAHPIWYASHGFIVVIQDVRGRGTSAGQFQLFIHEAQDGYDTVAWAAKLPQSSGKVGMYGFSYQGMTQLFAAQEKPTNLTAIAPAMVGYVPYEDWAYENGALLLQAGLGWAIQLAAETARLRQDTQAFQALYEASRQLPLTEENPICPDVLQRYAPESFFHDWIAHPKPDAYWQGLTPTLSSVDLPMLHVGGWFDPYLRGDVRLYREMEARSHFPQVLWIGPWGHIPWGRMVGGRDFGPQAHSPIDRIQVDWFTQLLKEEETGLLEAAPVHLFEMGSNCWRQFQHWPQYSTEIWALESDGLAAMDPSSGRLLKVATDEPGENAQPDVCQATSSTDWLVHDPWRPVPALGGHAGIPSGAFDRSALECRSDILTYTSAPLSVAMAAAGQIEATITCFSDRPSFDLSVVLSEVAPEGSSYPLTQGYGRFSARPGEWHTHTLKLQPTCFSIQAGYSIRLSISAACFPAYAVNPGTDIDDTTVRRIDAQIVTLGILGGKQCKSYVSIPSGHQV